MSAIGPLIFLWAVGGLGTAVISFFQWADGDLSNEEFCDRFGLIAVLPLVVSIHIVRGAFHAIIKATGLSS